MSHSTCLIKAILSIANNTFYSLFFNQFSINGKIEKYSASLSLVRYFLFIGNKIRSLESHKVHKIQTVHEAKEKGLMLQTAQELLAIPGEGISGMINGVSCKAGKIGLLHNQLLSEQEEFIVKQLEVEGKTVIYVQADDQLIGILAIQDVIRANAKETVSALKQMGMRVIMLTGDRNSTAQAIGAQLGVDQVHADLLPEDKVAIIKKMSATGKVAMIGDGVNDAPALAASSVGIAMVPREQMWHWRRPILYLCPMICPKYRMPFPSDAAHPESSNRT